MLGTLPPEPDIRRGASALALPLALGLRRLVHLDPRRLLTPGCAIEPRQRAEPVAAAALQPLTG